jgi:hypothetical protein
MLNGWLAEAARDHASYNIYAEAIQGGDIAAKNAIEIF